MEKHRLITLCIIHNCKQRRSSLHISLSATWQWFVLTMFCPSNAEILFVCNVRDKLSAIFKILRPQLQRRSQISQFVQQLHQSWLLFKCLLLHLLQNPKLIVVHGHSQCLSQNCPSCWTQYANFRSAV